MLTPSAAIVKERVEPGLYDNIGEQLVTTGAAALAGAEYSLDYKHCVEG